MTDVITKVSINGQVVPFGGGSTEGAEVVYLTQAEYDALPASKLTDGKIYKVKTTGVVPGGSVDASDVGYDNTTSGLTADNVQDAIDEVEGKFGAITGEGTPVNNGDFIGQMYKDTISGNMYIWNGSVWGGANSIINGDTNEESVSPGDPLPSDGVYDINVRNSNGTGSTAYVKLNGNTIATISGTNGGRGYHIYLLDGKKGDIITSSGESLRTFTITKHSRAVVLGYGRY